MSVSRWLIVAAVAAAPGLAAAQDGAGCAAFRWPLDQERAALAKDGKPTLANGGALTYGVATTLALSPLSEAGLPRAPERAPKAPQSFAGHFTLAAPEKPGVHKITISSEGWIDVIDGAGYLHPTGFTGATGCEGARKSVRFDLPAHPFVIQLSGVRDNRISVIVSE